MNVSKRATSRDEVLAIASACGWVADGENKKGYVRLRCSCGDHIKWVHKTPSNTRYWQECANKIRRTCCRDSVATEIIR